MPSKLVTIQYRYLRTDDLGDHFNLRDIVADVVFRAGGAGDRALSERVGARKKDLDADGSYVVLNNLSIMETEQNKVFVGELLYVRSGKEVAGLRQSLEEEVASVEIANLTLGERQSLVDGVLYFAIVDNHVAIVEGQRARGRTLERYLTRLLQDAAELEPGSVLYLNPKIQGLKADSVSKLSINPGKMRGTADEDGIEQTTEAGTETARDDTVIALLKVLGVDEQEIRSLEQSIPPGGWIEAVVSMSFKKKGGKKGAISRSQIETAFRNLNDRDLGLVDPQNGSERAGSMRLSHRVTVDYEGALLDPTNAMQAIIGVLGQWAHQGKIDLQF